MAGLAWRALYEFLAWRQPALFPDPSPGCAQTPCTTFPLAVYSHRGGHLEGASAWSSTNTNEISATASSLATPATSESNNGAQTVQASSAAGQHACTNNASYNVSTSISGSGWLPSLENTLAAFRRSARLGVDLLELDVQMSRDGKVVVFHDRQLGRMCGLQHSGKCIKDYKYSQLPELTDPYAAHSGANAIRGSSHTPTGNSLPLVEGVDSPDEVNERTRMPLLEEILTEFKGIPLQIDVKVANSPQLVQATAGLVSRFGRESTTLWGSFIHSTNTALFHANPRVSLFASTYRAAFLLAAYHAGVLHKVHIYEAAIIIPWRIPLELRMPGLSWPFFTKSLSPLHRGCFQALNERGVAVVVYGGCDDEPAYEACAAAGVNAICTDHPSRLQAWLAKHRPEGLPRVSDLCVQRQ